MKCLTKLQCMGVSLILYTNSILNPDMKSGGTLHLRNKPESETIELTFISRKGYKYRFTLESSENVEDSDYIVQWDDMNQIFYFTYMDIGGSDA